MKFMTILPTSRTTLSPNSVTNTMGKDLLTIKLIEKIKTLPLTIEIITVISKTPILAPTTMKNPWNSRIITVKKNIKITMIIKAQSTPISTLFRSTRIPAQRPISKSISPTI